MSYIAVDEDTKTVIFNKKVWFDEETSIATSLGFSFKDGSFIANLNSTRNIGLYSFMKYCFGKFVRDEKYVTDRESLYSAIRKCYDEINEKYRNDIKKLNYYNLLYRHQRESIRDMIKTKHNLLAFEQGLGKTVTAISISELKRINNNVKTLIVCPAICKWNWHNELLMWGVDKDDITVIDSKEKNTIISKHNTYIIINYDMLKKHKSKLTSKNFYHIILDEAHYIKNCKSQRYKLVEQIVKSCNAKISFLTGTPIWNRPEDMFAYLKLSGNPLGTNYKSFLSRYTHNYKNRWGGTTIIKGRFLFELSIKISNFMIRKLKTECLDLPEKIYTKYYFDFFEFSGDYSKCIRSIQEQDTIESYSSSIHTLNIVASKSKIKNIIELADNIIENGKKVVVFTSYTEPREILEQYYQDSCVSIHGGVDSKKRKELIDRFCNDDSCKIFLGNMQAAGIGINLHVASDAIFCNFPLTVSELQQAIDRLHRIGQSKNVNIYYTICKGSVDESIYDLIIDKAEDIKQVIDKGKKTIELKYAYSKVIKHAISKWNLKNNMMQVQA